MTLHVTLTGRAVGKSGLLPSTAFEFLGFLSRKAEFLDTLASSCARSALDDCDDFAFVMLHAAYNSTEYERAEIVRRYLPYQLLASPLNGPQGRVHSLLFEHSGSDALNAAVLAWRWIRGTETRDLESVLEIRSGVLMGMFADASNILRGVADILFAATSARSVGERPLNIDEKTVPLLRKLLAAIRLIAIRLDTGLPDDVAWMRTLSGQGSNAGNTGARQTLLSRQQIILLREASFQAPSDILDSGRFPELLTALGPRSAVNRQLAQDLQHATRNWRVEERGRLIENQKKRLPVECRNVLLRYYRAKEIEFEEVLEEVLSCFGINVDARDDGTISSFPDFIIKPIPPPVFAIECKSKTVGDVVTFNDATDVIRKAGVNGYSEAFKVTVCQPYISPDVPRKLGNCSDLCVVNAEDLAEAFVRIRTGELTKLGFFDWLSRPGQALRGNLSSSRPTLTGQ